LGAKINRLYLVGVLTDVEHVAEGGDLVRAHISDPTGVFTLYSGQYQPEATEQLSAIEVPAFVAIVGKARTYEPEEGSLYVSIRPEIVHEVSTDLRDQWILETCQQTKDRIQATIEVQKMNEVTITDLKQLGYSSGLCEGLTAAKQHYPTVEIQKYLSMIRESLEYLGPRSIPPLEKQPEDEVPKKATPKKPIKKTPPAEQVSESGDDSDAEATIMKIVKQLEGDDGAAWDDIVQQCEKQGLSEVIIEEALSSLMDKGMVYEPILGTIKTT
jgi:RPA family protein